VSTPSRKRPSTSGAATKQPAPEQPWVFAAIAAGVAVLAAAATGFHLVPEAMGLAVTVIGVLALLAERGVGQALVAGKIGPAVAVALGWMAVSYVPFHALLFPGAPLHEPIRLRAADPALPITIATAGTRAVDLVLEGELPPSPGGGAPIPVDYSLVFKDGAGTEHVTTGRFDDHARTVRRGRRGTGTVLQPHHEERHLLDNPARADMVVTTVSLEPAADSAILVTAFRHRLPSTPILALLGTVFVAGVAALDALVIPASDGLLTLATPAVIGTALILWTSNTAHPGVSSLIGAAILGAPLGLAVGALLRMVARRSFA
jgi:hypothetical protein